MIFIASEFQTYASSHGQKILILNLQLLTKMSNMTLNRTTGDWKDAVNENNHVSPALELELQFPARKSGLIKMTTAFSGQSKAVSVDRNLLLR